MWTGCRWGRRIRWWGRESARGFGTRAWRAGECAGAGVLARVAHGEEYRVPGEQDSGDIEETGELAMSIAGYFETRSGDLRMPRGKGELRIVWDGAVLSGRRSVQERMS